MPRRDDRYRTNSLNQLQEVRQRNIDILNRRTTPDDTSEENEYTTDTVDFNRVNWGYAIDRPSQNYWRCEGWTSTTPRYKYIKSYNYIPDKFNFNSNDCEDDKLYLGIELEIDKGGKNDDTAKYIQEFLGETNCYIVHDGSLQDGLEIVTHPSTLNFHKQQPYSDLFKELSKKGYKSHDTSTCGYHIHINRNFFSENPTIQDLCITKILYLFEKFWYKVKTIARRDSNRYAQRFYMKENDSMFDLLIKAKGEYSSKYNVINLNHKNTIEFRIFRGTLKYETFIATMEFIHNLAYLCKEVPLENIQNIKFKDILDMNPTEYLITYINSRNKNK